LGAALALVCGDVSAGWRGGSVFGRVMGRLGDVKIWKIRDGTLEREEIGLKIFGVRCENGERVSIHKRF